MITVPLWMVHSKVGISPIGNEDSPWGVPIAYLFLGAFMRQLCRRLAGMIVLSLTICKFVSDNKILCNEMVTIFRSAKSATSDTSATLIRDLL